MPQSINPAIYAACIALAVVVVLCPLFIPILRRLKFGQPIREDGPATHAKKAGVPTMGGIVILIGLVLAALPFAVGKPEGLAVVAATAAFGAIGFIDDYIKVVKKRSLGLRAYQKLILQLAVSVGFVLYWRTLSDYSSAMVVPFFPQASIDLGVLHPVFICFIFIGAANGANLTDGLDGLAAGVTAIIAVFFMLAAQTVGSGAMPVAGAMAGGLLGFLLFNAYPARVIMGDTGSQALGGFVASMAVILRMPLFLVLVALIYIIESLSVIIQVGYFKLTRRRFFKMAPIHHSFELSGWPETRVVAFFCVVTAAACLLGLAAMQ